MKVSLFASAIKPHCWETLLESLKSNSVEYEVIFCGYIDKSILDMVVPNYPELKYISTKDIKPAQCYEIARRECKGEIIGWISDDCVFPEKALDSLYEFCKFMGEKIIVAPALFDKDCNVNDLNLNRFFPRNLNTPQMAQVGFMHREYLDKLGGIDNRYLYGKWESDICMRAYADGGKVVKFERIQIGIEHTSKDGLYNNDWSGYNEDSEILENSWVLGGYASYPKPLVVLDKQWKPEIYYPIDNREVTFVRNDTFHPYELPISTEKSQSNKSRWE